MGALELLQKRAHPLLQQTSNLTPAPLEGEFEAAATYGYTPDLTYTIDENRNWFALPRPTRAAMVVYLRVSRLGASLNQYDSAEREKAKRKK